MRRPPSRCALPLFALLFACFARVELVHAQAEGAAASHPDEPAQSPASDAPVEATSAEAEADEAGGVDTGLDDERARAHFFAGESHYGAGRFGDAAREFALAYELSRRPEMLVNLARAHQREGALRAAIADLELLLLQHPTTSYRGEAEQRLSELRARLAQASREEARLPAFTSAAPELPKAERGGPRLPAWPRYALAAGALASATVALATGLRAHDIYGELEGRCPGGGCSEPFADDRDRGRALARASTGLTFASVVLGGAAAALWLYDLRARKRRVAVGARVDATAAVLQLRSRF